MAYQKPVIAPPWLGWVDALPSNVAQMNSFRQITNWLFNKGRIMPFPNLTAFPPVPDNNPVTGNPFAILGMDSFQDQLYNWHTILLTQNAPVYIDPSSISGFFLPTKFGGGSSAFQPQSLNPFSIEIYANQAYFANAGNKLAYVNGDHWWFEAGDVPGTCYFLG